MGRCIDSDRGQREEITGSSALIGALPWDMMMTTVEPMTARGAHYTALLGAIDHQGAAKLHANEREQLLEAADALLFGEPENRRLLRSAEDVIEALEASGRWSAESCDQLREHLYGCDGAAGVG
jgi:hypothetical protein